MKFETFRHPILGELTDRTVCYCHAVPLSEILGAIQRGATTLYDIQLETLASTGCGGCEPEILEIFENLAPNQKL